MASKVLSLFRRLRGKKKNGPAAAPAQQPAEPEQLQPLQDDAAKDRSQEQEPTHGRFRRAAQALRRFLHLRRRNTSATVTGGTAQPDSMPSELRAEPAASTAPAELAASCERAAAEGRAEADMALTEGMATTNTLNQAIQETDAVTALTVLATVRAILQRLASCDTVDAGLQMAIVSLTEDHPAHVVMSLLHCAPLCDRAATLMWRAMGTSEVAVEEVLPALLSVVEKQPPHGRIFCSGNEAAFALAATLVLRRIVPTSEWHYGMLIYSPQLLVDLLLEIFSATEQMPEDVETRSFWRVCREEHGLPSDPNRFAAQTMKALLSRLGFDKKLAALEHTQVWDALLCADTQHEAAGLLAREMRRGLSPLCPHMASHLLSLLIRKQPRRDLPALAFFVELLDCLDLSRHGPRALWLLSRHLPSQCRDRLRLQLRGLMLLSKEPSLGGGIRGLYQHLLEQLRDPNAEMLWTSLSVLTHVLQDKDLKIPSITALKLAEPQMPHFDNDNSQLQLLSIQLFSQVMELGVEEGEEALTRILSQSLLPLFLRLARGQGISRSPALCGTLPEEDGPGGAADEVRPEPGKDSPAAPAAGWRSPLAPVLSVGGWQLCPCPAPHPGPPACAPHAAPCPGPCGPARPVPGSGSARPRGRARAGPSLPALPAAVAGPEPSGRAPALRPAAPPEPVKAPARDGRQHHRGGRSS